jgi:hypothetical protein
MFPIGSTLSIRIDATMEYTTPSPSVFEERWDRDDIHAEKMISSERMAMELRERIHAEKMISSERMAVELRERCTQQFWRRKVQKDDE